MATKRNRLEQKNIVVWSNADSIDQNLIGAISNSIPSNNSANPNAQILQESITDVIQRPASSSKKRVVKINLPPTNFRSKKLKLIPDVETQTNNDSLKALQQEDNLSYVEQANDTTVDENSTDEDLDNVDNLDDADFMEKLDNFDNAMGNLMEEMRNSDTEKPNGDEDAENDGNVETIEVNTSCENCKNTSHIILRKLNEILQILDASHGNNATNREAINDFSTLGNFPLQSVKKVERLERKLKEDVSLMELFKQKIATIGGKNAELTVRNALKMILSDKVAVRYSWTGAKKSIKFSQHKIVDGIIETVRQVFGNNTTITDLQNVIMEWLRHAGDRVRYQEKRELEAMKKV